MWQLLVSAPFHSSGSWKTEVNELAQQVNGGAFEPKLPAHALFCYLSFHPAFMHPLAAFEKSHFTHLTSSPNLVGAKFIVFLRPFMSMVLQLICYCSRKFENLLDWVLWNYKTIELNHMNHHFLWVKMIKYQVSFDSIYLATFQVTS
jgi:hypothetical protein